MILNPATMSMQYEDIYELNYAVLNAIGLSCPNGYLFDQDTHLPIKMFDKKIKVMIDPTKPIYAGEGEIMFDIIHNIKLVTYLLGYSLEKKASFENKSILTQYIDNLEGTMMTSLTVKFYPEEKITSDFFNNKCLKFVHMIFQIDNLEVDLHNFDEEIPLS